MSTSLALYLAAAAHSSLAARALVLSGPHLGGSLCLTRAGTRAGTLGDDALDTAVLPLLQRALETQQTQRVTVDSAAGAIEVLLDVTAPPPRLIVIGAVHTAIALGFETIVLDSRAAFATPERFGHAHALHVCWPADALAALAPDETTYIVVLTHDAKIDNPALAYALTTPARYIGALGSRRTHAARLDALRDMGVDEAALVRIHAPIGLDLGGSTPEETALAILSEIVQVKNDREQPR